MKYWLTKSAHKNALPPKAIKIKHMANLLYIFITFCVSSISYGMPVKYIYTGDNATNFYQSPSTTNPYSLESYISGYILLSGELQSNASNIEIYPLLLDWYFFDGINEMSPSRGQYIVPQSKLWTNAYQDIINWDLRISDRENTKKGDETISMEVIYRLQDPITGFPSIGPVQYASVNKCVSEWPTGGCSTTTLLYSMSAYSSGTWTKVPSPNTLSLVIFGFIVFAYFTALNNKNML